MQSAARSMETAATWQYQANRVLMTGAVTLQAELTVC